MTDPSALEARAKDAERRLAQQDKLLRGAMIEKGAAMLRSIEETRAREVASAALVHRDPGTGLWRHGRFRERIGFEIARCARLGDPLALLLADVDALAGINAEHGYGKGDDVLATIGKSLGGLWLDRALPRPPILGREDGGTFGAVLPGINLEEARAAAEEVRALVERLPLQRTRATVTVGGIVLRAGAPAEGADRRTLPSVEQVVMRARAAIRAARGAGSNRVEVVEVEALTNEAVTP